MLLPFLPKNCRLFSFPWSLPLRGCTRCRGCARPQALTALVVHLPPGQPLQTCTLYPHVHSPWTHSLLMHNVQITHGLPLDGVLPCFNLTPACPQPQRNKHYAYPWAMCRVQPQTHSATHIQRVPLATKHSRSLGRAVTQESMCLPWSVQLPMAGKLKMHAMPDAMHACSKYTRTKEHTTHHKRKRHALVPPNCARHGGRRARGRTPRASPLGRASRVFPSPSLFP